MAHHNLELNDIYFDVMEPSESRHAREWVWQDCYELGVAAFQAGMPQRKPEEIAAFMGDKYHFADYHRWPQHMVDDGLVNANQTVNRAYLAVAFVQPEPFHRRVVGFAYSADNISGTTDRQRSIKQLTLVKNYRWLEKIAVHPDFQGRGIAQALGYLTFRQAYPLQPASAYTWPSETTQGARLLEKWGVEDDGGRQPVRPFGESGDEITQHRHAARSARRVARRIARQNSNPDIFKELKKEFSGFGKFLQALDRDSDEMISRNPLG